MDYFQATNRFKRYSSFIFEDFYGYPHQNETAISLRNTRQHAATHIKFWQEIINQSINQILFYCAPKSLP